MMELKATQKREAYRVSEVVKMTGISRTAAYRLIKNGKIPSVKLGEVVVIPAWWVAQTFENPATNAI